MASTNRIVRFWRLQVTLTRNGAPPEEGLQRYLRTRHAVTRPASVSPSPRKQAPFLAHALATPTAALHGTLVARTF